MRLGLQLHGVHVHKVARTVVHSLDRHVGGQGALVWDLLLRMREAAVSLRKARVSLVNISVVRSESIHTLWMHCVRNLGCMGLGKAVTLLRAAERRLLDGSWHGRLHGGLLGRD